jgi:adenylate kinase family enzyme
MAALNDLPHSAPAQRVLIMGNSSAGKTTLALRLAAERALVHLDLDGLVWEPGDAAARRDSTSIIADLDAFLARHRAWVIEGCYGELIERALPSCSELIFLNPSVAACLANSRRRPWEPKKYSSAEEQNRRRASLRRWIESYPARNDACSLRYHRRLFDAFAGPKREVFSLSGA